ncbi:hypothetical protein JCM11641_000878 [Rhodosporidiobolus odoratus]
MPPQRALTLSFSCVSALSAGTNYVFSGYSPQLAQQLHLSSLAINAVGAAGNAGVYLSGPLVGLVVDSRGPRIVLLGAAACLAVGYFGLYALYAGGEDGLYATWGLPGLAICQILAGTGGSAALSAAVKATSLSFSKAKRGAAMATVLSCFGLSAFFYSTLSHANLLSTADPIAGFLLTLALGTGISMLLGAAFVHPPPTSHSATVPVTTQGQYLAVSTSDSDPSFPSPSSSRPQTPIHDPASSEYSLHSDILACEGDLPVRPANRRRQRSSSPLLEEREDDEPRHGAGDLDVTGWDLLRLKDFWALFGYLGLCSGVGLMWAFHLTPGLCNLVNPDPSVVLYADINNLGTVALTLAASDPDVEPDPRAVAKSQAYLVSLLSVFNCLGRLFVGFSSDTCLHHLPSKMRVARIWWLVVTAVLFVFSQHLAGQTSHVSGLAGLAVPTALTGFAYGCLFGSVPIVGLERFGMANYARNNGFLTLSPSVFANLTNLLFGAVYDSHVAHSSSDTPFSAELPDASSALTRRAADSTPAHLCTDGRECFATAFQATTLMSLAAVVLAVLLARRRNFHPVYRI